MSLHRQLQQRAADGRPIRVGLIGAGKFGSMYLAQVPRTPGVHLVAIADLGTFAAAAQALHLSPPAISLHIKELESRMNEVLVVRGRRRAELTHAGSILVADQLFKLFNVYGR